MSVNPRLYLDQALSEECLLTLDKDQSHYLSSVMRRSVGDGVRLFNGRDGEWAGQILEASRKAVRVKVRERLREQAGVPDLWLCFAPVKKARTDFIVEKATELGVSRIQPVITARTIADRVKTERLSALAREAAEQTERLDLPEIAEPVSLTQLINTWDPSRTLIFADEAGEGGETPWSDGSGLARPMIDQLTETKAAILIGPEGGFAPEERALLRQQDFITPVTLGPRILRADTAAVAALTLWQAHVGDWR